MKKLLSLALIFSLVCSVCALAGAEEKKKDEKKKPEPAAVFKKLDANGDGKLTFEEFLGKRGEDKKAAAEKQFKAKDKDSSGDLSLEEFSAAPAKKPKKDKE